MMRYTYFFKLPGQPYIFDESNNKQACLSRARNAAQHHPEATITVCDRSVDCMIWQQNAFEGDSHGHCNVALGALCN